MSLDDLPTRAPQPTESEPAVPRVDRPSSLVDKITRAEELRLQLADEIVRGTLPPGAGLDETDLARRFNVSRTPVREALRQLAASGLIDARAHRGAVVARPSLERLTGMFEAMAELEAMCAGLAAERMTPAERHALEAVHEELRVLSYTGNPERFHEVNERFHNAIYAGSPSTTASWSPSCAVTSPARRPRCATISSTSAGNTRPTRCRCSVRGNPSASSFRARARRRAPE